jgi:uncharacterized RDD family membrane protein YckC
MEQAPLNREGTPSIQEALSQAEQEHWLERPNAPLAIRLASFVLDLIFIYLFIHGQHRLLQALSIYSATSTQTTLFLLNPFFLGFVDIFVRTSFLFFYLVFSVSHFGGTLGNLLLGLRVVDDQSGRKLSLARSTTRLLFGVSTNLLSLSVAMSRPDGRTLHDLLSRTIIKKIRGRA